MHFNTNADRHDSLLVPVHNYVPGKLSNEQLLTGALGASCGVFVD